MKPREDEPARFRSNVFKSWKIMAEVTKRITDESFFAHLELIEGVGYDCLSLITRATDKNPRIRFHMNRNGSNSDVLEKIWAKSEPEWLGIEGVAE